MEHLTKEEILQLTGLLNQNLVDMEESLENGPWSLEKEKYTKIYLTYSELNFKLVRMASNMEFQNEQKNANENGIVLGKNNAYGFLFDGENNDFDEIFKDFIEDDNETKDK
ncbi:hypothetical protein [Bacillus sp. J33]|uniref:hypothetical protein n=1 Tax=Bacillus sp. J33 TaxID=935836 RepID=UPI00047B1C91|nr:hypothetical protein [Bacillus sp. J33]